MFNQEFSRRAADKKKYEDILAHNENELLIMSHKLQLAESKQRFAEQAGRDENNVTSSISRVEYDELKREYDALREKYTSQEDEFIQRGVVLQQLTLDYSNSQMSKQELERANARLEQKVDEYNRKFGFQNDRLKEARDEGERALQDAKRDFDQMAKEMRGKIEHISKELLIKTVRNSFVIYCRVGFVFPAKLHIAYNFV